MPKKLTKGRYALVRELISAANEGIRLAKDDLATRADVADAVNGLKRLADSDQRWKNVIELAGEKGRGYGIQ